MIIETVLRNTTFNVLLDRMIKKVNEQNSNIDTREGSIIYNALAPAAVELQNLYIQLEAILHETFADTASRYYLIKRAAEHGIYVMPASKAVRQGVFNKEIPLGSRFSLNILNYKTIEKLSQSDGLFYYKMECETPGDAGNTESGQLIPIEYIEGLTKAELTDVLIPGENEEETEHLRKRYFDSLNSQAFGGNIADYIQKVNSIPGVGGVKVIPHWKGGGTVKLIIIDSDYHTPSNYLINTVQTIVDPTVNQGKGYGTAPIGHIVTVVGCTEMPINISLNLVFKMGFNFSLMESVINRTILEYFDELSAKWDSSDVIVIRISQIETRLLSLNGILDIADTKINGQPKNLILENDEIPIKGVISNG